MTTAGTMAYGVQKSGDDRLWWMDTRHRSRSASAWTLNPRLARTFLTPHDAQTAAYLECSVRFVDLRVATLPVDFVEAHA